ncbi:MAG TPA: chromate efflux transporter [Treponemataceae bacterium]|nr:chromate efflux transporter [Treponemataceae bacterium]HQL05755.1 chromate efflux transporter [Treponemataceae bacterium]
MLKYLSEEDLAELIALTGILPGPSSTQTIIAIGYKTGGLVLAFLTFLVWAVPVVSLMILLSFMYTFFASLKINTDILRFIGPMAVGFMASAAWRLGKKTTTSVMSLTILLTSAVITFFIRTAWIYPLVLAAGGFTAWIFSKEDKKWNRITMRPPWRYVIIFAGIALASLVLAAAVKNPLTHLFESFYRYGYLVIGGGQVVIPLMFSDLTEVHSYMTTQEFLTGYGLVQGLPGPMFSFSAYAGGMASRGSTILYQILGGLAGGIGIFLPGILLIYFVYPVWEQLKQIKAIKIAIKGIVSSASGLILASTAVLLVKNGFAYDTLAVTAITTALLLSKKVSAPIIVVLAIAAGFLPV